MTGNIVWLVQLVVEVLLLAVQGGAVTQESVTDTSAQLTSSSFIFSSSSLPSPSFSSNSFTSSPSSPSSHSFHSSSSSFLSSAQSLGDAGGAALVKRTNVVEDDVELEFCCTHCCPSNYSASSTPLIADVSLPNGEASTQRMKVELMEQALSSIGWESVFVIFDDRNEDLVKDLTTYLSEKRTGIMYRLDKTEGAGNDSFIRRAMADTLSSTYTINGVVACSLHCIASVLRMTLSLEAQFRRRVLMTSSTKWLLVPTSAGPGDAAILGEIFALGFDNIAVMADPASLPFPYFMPEEFTCSALTVSTLLWKGGERRQLSPVGHYCSHKGPEIMSDIFPNTGFGFNGRAFIVSTLSWDPYVMREDVNETITYYGFCADLMEELALTLNFTYTWTEPADEMWGGNQNGNWTGLVGQLNRQEVDMTMAPLTLSKEREEAMDFTFPFYHDFTGVLLKRPDPNARKWRTYIDIFRWEVLVCLALALVGSAAVAITIEAGERSILGRAHMWIAVNRFWVVLGALLSQGTRQLPRRGSGRVFLSSWWLFSIVLAATYSGNLIAFLTVTKDKAPFDTLEEMVKQTEYTYGTMDESVWSMLFQYSSEPTYQAIHRNMQEFAKTDPGVLAQDPYEHLEKVRQGGYAYIADTGMFDNWLATSCDLMLIKEKFHPAKYALGLPNESAYTKLFSDQIMKIYEGGLLQVMVDRWWPKRNFCVGSLTTEAKVLDLVDTQSVFYVAGVGVGVAAVALVIEFVTMALCPGIRRAGRGAARDIGPTPINDGFSVN